jgi:Carboxypeptidase regulatory-like domain/TonB dependent receptor
MFKRNTVQKTMHIVLLALLTLFVSVPAFAQSTSASVAGRIIDGQGAPVAGATVEILHQPSGTKSSLVTDADGRFSTRGLRVGGPYTVTASKDDLDAASRDDVFLLLAETASVTLTLATDATQLEAMEVVGSTALSTFTPDNMGAATNITVEQIQEMPSIGRSIQDYVRFDPRIVQTDKERGQISAAGQNNRFNNIRIDGVPTNDNFGLNDSGLPSINQPISIDWIQEFNVGISNFDVTQKDFVGANINAVTKSGGNEFHGGAYALYRDSDMVGDEPSKFTAFNDEYTVGAYVGGPIIQDTLFFFLGYEEFQRSDVRADIGLVGSGASTVVQNVTQADVDRIVQIAQTQYNFRINDLNFIDNTDDKVFAKVDWNINDQHRMTYRYNNTDGQVLRIGAQNPTTLRLPSAYYTDNIGFENHALLLYSNWNDWLSTEANISYSKYDSSPTTDVRSPAVTVNINGTNVIFGTDNSRHANQLKVDTLTGYFAADMFLGEHTLRAGFDYEANDVFNLFLQNVFGNYTFQSSGTGAATVSAIDNFASGTWRSYTLQYANSGNINSAAANFDVSNVGFFVQDTWNYSSNLNFQYGLRIDRGMVGSEPPFNQSAFDRFGFDNSNTADGQVTVQPRLGFNYTFDSEHATQLRGGVGLFQGSAPGVWLSNIFSNPGTLSSVVTAQNCGPAATTLPCGFNADPNNQPRPTTAAAAQNVDFLSNDFTQPTVWKINLAFERELPWMGLVGSVEWLRNVTEEGVFFQHLNLGTPGGIGTLPGGVLPDGRNSYWTTVLPTGFNGTGGTAGGNQSRARRSAAFNNVILLSNTTKGEADNITIGVEKPFSDNWGAKVAYTYGKSNDVNPGTSSVANSNWNGRSVYNPNELVSSTSNYEIRDRYTGIFTYRTSSEEFPTTFGVFYEGRSGRPFSYGFAGDANGDGVGNNDLFYIPLQGEVSFTAASSAADIAAFWEYIASEDYLTANQGQVAQRNKGRSPFINQFDLRITQDFPGGWGNRAQVFLDIQNIGNLINKDWGLIDEVGFPYNLGVATMAGVEGGRYVYDVRNYVNETTGITTLPATIRRDAVGESRWAVQLGLRYEF